MVRPVAALVTSLKQQWFPALLVVGLIVAVGQNVWLGTTNTALRARLLEVLSQPVLVGDRVRDLRGVELDGRYRAIEVRPGGTLVIAISPFCGVCIANRSEVLKLAEIAHAARVKVVWVSRDRPEETRTYFNDLSVEGGDLGTVLSEPPSDTYEALRLSVVPQTLVLDRSGIITASVTGVLDESKVELLEKAIHKQAAVVSAVSAAGTDGKTTRVNPEGRERGGLDDSVWWYLDLSLAACCWGNN